MHIILDVRPLRTGVSVFRFSTHVHPPKGCRCHMDTIMHVADWTSARTMRAYYLGLLPREALINVNTVQNVKIN